MTTTARVTCRHCGTPLTRYSHIYVDGNRSRRGTDGHQHTPAYMRTSDLLDLVYGEEGADDPLTTALRRAGL